MFFAITSRGFAFSRRRQDCSRRFAFPFSVFRYRFCARQFLHLRASRRHRQPQHRSRQLRGRNRLPQPFTMQTRRLARRFPRLGSGIRSFVRVSSKRPFGVGIHCGQASARSYRLLAEALLLALFLYHGILGGVLSRDYPQESILLVGS